MNTRKPTPPAQRALCLILAFLLSCSLFATGGAPQVNTPETQAPTEAPIPETPQTPTEEPAAEEYTLPLEDDEVPILFHAKEDTISLPALSGKRNLLTDNVFDGKVQGITA